MSEKMETQKAMEVLSKFFNLLDKQKNDNEAKPAIYKAGDVITMTVEDVTKDGQIVLDDESQIILAALIPNISENSLLGKYISVTYGNGWPFTMDQKYVEQMKSFDEELSLFIKQRKAMQVDLEKFLAATQPLADPEFVDALLELIREVDPQRADEVEAAMRGNIQTKDEELADLRRQLAEMQRQRDEAIDIAKQAMAQSHASPTQPEQATEAKTENKQGGNNKSGKRGRQEVNHNNGGENGDNIMNMVADGQPVTGQENAA